MIWLENFLDHILTLVMHEREKICYHIVSLCFDLWQHSKYDAFAIPLLVYACELGQVWAFL